MPPSRPAPNGYSKTQIALHWAVVLLVAAQYLLNETISGAWSARTAGETFAFHPLILAHVAGGSLILALVVWRVVLRLRRGVPLPPANEPALLRSLGHLAHWAFYAILAGMAVSGMVAWFGGVTQAAAAHNVLKVALLALVALHVLAVILHRIVLKNDLLGRMIRPAD